MPELNVFSTKKILRVAQNKMVEVIGFNFCLLFLFIFVGIYPFKNIYFVTFHNV